MKTNTKTALISVLGTIAVYLGGGELILILFKTDLGIEIFTWTIFIILLVGMVVGGLAGAAAAFAKKDAQ